MPQSLASIYLHAVFSCESRHPYVSDPNIRAELFAFLAGASRTLDCPTIIVGGVADHLQLLARFGRNISVAEWIKEIKRTSSIEAKKMLPKFSWQAGYGVFSVDQLRLNTVAEYIRNQEEHHRSISFQDEFRSLLREHNIEWDERYVWD